MVVKPITHTREVGDLERFPEYPPRDDMQNSLHLYERAIITTLKAYLKDKPNVFVGHEIPVSERFPFRGNTRIPDLLVIFDADRGLIVEQNGYEIIHHGKAPEFALEVASPTTGVTDYTAKRSDYERFGISEYWRFDPSGGEYHDSPLAGDRLVDGRYEPIEVAATEDGTRRGYSEALGLHLCWEDGLLRFYDPATGEYLRTHDEEIARADEEAARADEEAAGRRAAEERADEEAAGRRAAEERADEEAARSAALEAEIRRLRGE